MFKIGNIELKNKVCLAPMAGIGNSAYRKIIREMGAGLIFAEMVSDKAIYYDNKKTIDMLYMEEVERPIVQQIFGSDVESFVYAAKFIEREMNPCIIDINMGCPVKKVAIKAQAGAALMKDPEKIRKIVSAVSDAVKCPVTVKIRSGWDDNSINAVEVAKICEAAGASAITVHPRTRKQAFTGKANWDIIKQVKENVGVPVIGNGDITTPEDAKRMLEETNCDAVMIGRAVISSPFIIREIVAYLEEKEIPARTKEEIIQVALRHFGYLVELKSEKVAVQEFRLHLSNYIKGFNNAKEIRQEIMLTKTAQDMIKLIKSLD